MTRNPEVAAALNELADLLELKGSDRFRLTAYRRAADAVETLGRDVAALDERQLVALQGVGKAMASKIREFLDSGTMQRLEELRLQVPAGVRAFTRLPGVGPKRAALLFSSLGVSTFGDLRAAAESGRVREVPGLGQKAEEAILAALAGSPDDLLERRVLLVEALRTAEPIVEALRASHLVVDCAYAGSLRRMRETIGDVDVLVATEHQEQVTEVFRALPGVAQTDASGPTKTTVLTPIGLSMDLRVVKPDEFGSALQYFTGSKAHNVKVREHAVRRGWKLSEYGLFDADGTRVAGGTEAEVYEALGLTFIPPTMREDLGEVEAALRGALPRVVETSDMRGDLQTHSTYSDGKASLRRMLETAIERGYEYYAVTDHGQRLGGVKNLSLGDIEDQRREVAELNREFGDRIRLLHGVELNISPDGDLDYDDDVLAGFDVVVASIHSSLQMPRDQMTKRVVKALRHPLVNVWGHPTARRMDRRGPIDIDLEPVFQAAVENDVALEINGHPYRLDLKDDHIRWARTLGARFAISTDGHSPAELGNMRFGIANAQRAWVEPSEVINTHPLDGLLDFLRKR